MSFFIMALGIVFLDIITVWGIKKTFPKFSSHHKRGIRIAFMIQVILSLVIVLGGYFLGSRIRDYRMFALYYYLFGFMLAMYLPKTLFVLFLIIDSLISLVRRRKRKKRNLQPHPSRHILAKCGAVICLFFAGLIAWGILFGRYNFTLEPAEITFETLPPAFDGYKIVQISDIHAGSFAGFTKRFKKAVDLINEQNPDLIVFTGDMVNNFAEEAYPLVPIFSQLKARDGKYAILGNHDYGGYYKWETPADSVANHADLEHYIDMMGFVLLKNQAVVIGKDSLNRIALIGIENWGVEQRHPKRGDIVQATGMVRDIPFKVLLSHDPSFWPEQVAGKTDIALTLSGHTHGMQMGVRFGKEHFSPARLQHRYWSGLYYIGNQYLYVNRGLGVIGYPGRIGMSPEITVITLHRRF